KGTIWAAVSGYANKPIFAISKNTLGKLLVGTTEKITHPQNKVIDEIATRSFANFQGATFAATFGLGLVQISPDGQTVVHTDNSVNALCAVDDKLWFGTSTGGLFSFDGRGVKVEFSPDSLKSGTIWKIFQAADLSIW